MNAYTKFMDISMLDLPEPLTSVDQTSFPWFKFAHVEYLLDPEISSLSLEAQGALMRLLCHSARQYPYGSLPNDMPHLVKAAGFLLPDPLAKGYAKAYMRAEHVVESVLEAAFIQCRDDRFYSPLLANELTAEPKPVPVVPAGHNIPSAAPAGAPLSTGQHTTPPTVKRQSSSAERMQRKRERERLLKQQQDSNSKSDASPNHSDASHVTPEGVTCDGCDTQCDAVTVDVTPKASHVTGSSVTNEGGKGGDVDLNPDLDLDSASKKNKTNPDSAGQQAHEPDYFQTPDLGWTPRLGLLNARLKMAGHKPVTQEVLLQTLVTFNPHYDDQPVISDNNRTGKLVNWIGDKQQQAARQPYKQSASKPNPNTTYYGISKDDVQKHARAGETEFDCAKRLASERSNPPNTSSPPEKKPAAVWSIGDKSTLKQIQQLDTSITPERIDAMAKQQGKPRDELMATLYHTLATEQKKQDIAAAKAKVGQS